MIRAHKNAVLARLRSDAALASVVVDGAVDPNAPPVLPPYVVVYMDSGRRSVDRISSVTPTQADFRITTHCVGVDVDQAEYLAEKVFSLLLGWTPVVNGWSPVAIQHQRTAPPQTDRSVNPATQYISDVFTFTSRTGHYTPGVLYPSPLTFPQ